MYHHIGPIMQISEISGLSIAMYRICTKAIFITNGSFMDAEPTNIIVGLVQKGFKPLRGFKIIRIHVSPYRANNANFRNFEASFRHGTVFAPKQYLYQKEGLGMQSPKIPFLGWCKNGTKLYGASNYPHSCITI